jgi:hypothetical protein
MFSEKKTRRRITEQHSMTITGKELLEVISQELTAVGKDRLPAGADIYVSVPGGGDWSSTDLDLNEHSIKVRWTVEIEE